jgi:creatinine amidohydrolase
VRCAPAPASLRVLRRWEHAQVFSSRAEEIAAEHEHLFPHGGPINYGWMAQDLAASGVVGDATGADAARGEEVVRHYAGVLATLLGEVARADCDAILTQVDVSDP